MLLLVVHQVGRQVVHQIVLLSKGCYLVGCLQTRCHYWSGTTSQTGAAWDQALLLLLLWTAAAAVAGTDVQFVLVQIGQPPEVCSLGHARDWGAAAREGRKPAWTEQWCGGSVPNAYTAIWMPNTVKLQYGGHMIMAQLAGGLFQQS